MLLIEQDQRFNNENYYRLKIEQNNILKSKVTTLSLHGNMLRSPGYKRVTSKFFSNITGCFS